MSEHHDEARARASNARGGVRGAEQAATRMAAWYGGDSQPHRAAMAELAFARAKAAAALAISDAVYDRERGYVLTPREQALCDLDEQLQALDRRPFVFGASTPLWRQAIAVAEQ